MFFGTLYRNASQPASIKKYVKRWLFKLVFHYNRGSLLRLCIDTDTAGPLYFGDSGFAVDLSGVQGIYPSDTLQMSHLVKHLLERAERKDSSTRLPPPKFKKYRYTLLVAIFGRRYIF